MVSSGRLSFLWQVEKYLLLEIYAPYARRPTLEATFTRAINVEKCTAETASFLKMVKNMLKMRCERLISTYFLTFILHFHFRFLKYTAFSNVQTYSNPASISLLISSLVLATAL